jgi:hypothetical protein
MMVSAHPWFSSQTWLFAAEAPMIALASRRGSGIATVAIANQSSFLLSNEESP